MEYFRIPYFHRAVWIRWQVLRLTMLVERSEARRSANMLAAAWSLSKFLRRGTAPFSKKDSPHARGWSIDMIKSGITVDLFHGWNHLKII